MLFSAEISDFKIMHNVLKAISLKEFAILKPMEEGLKLTLEDMKTMEVSAYFPVKLFSRYHIDTTADVIFKISLKVLAECLNIFGDDGNPSLKFSYQATGSPLSLVMTHLEENITVDCEIKTLNLDDYQDVGLADECNLNKVVISASLFQELLQRLDNLADEITISLSPDPPYFRLATTGTAGESEVSISKNTESITVFQCSEAASAQYNFANIRQILKVMNLADKVAISTGESGLLGLQLVIVSDEKQMYVEYYVTSLFGDAD